MRKHKGRRGFLAVCTIPALVLFGVFMIYPTLNIFIISMYKWGGYSQNREFVGLDNFVKLFSDAKFWQSFQNTVLLIVVVTIVTMAMALVTAAVLTREKLRFKGFFRVVFYIPNILSAVVIAAIFSAIYDPSRGLLNTLLSLFTGGKAGQVLWLGDQKIVIYSIAIAMIWQAVGYYMVMYTASMSSVPESMYEAASLEGAGRVRQFFSITIPLIWTNIRTTLTFFIISSINISFLLVRAMTSGGPDGSTEVFLSYMYKQAYTNSSYGYGMAIGVLVFLFSFALSGLINLVTRRESIDL
ncbi:MAG: sugar ABC transporter permease [Clostridiales bacterium]|nr:sugar ABC transporter permease [Clostridiales bacterium]